MTISTSKIPVREVAAGADDMVTVADTNVSTALQQLAALRVARAGMLRREIQRRERGDRGADCASHVAVLKARLDNDVEFAGEAETARLRGQLDAPKSEPDSWALYGVVLQVLGEPAANHRLAMLDQRSGKQLGETYTNAQGLFSMKIDGLRGDVDPDNGGPRSELLARLQVLDAAGTLIYSENNAADIVAGNVEYREISLKDVVNPPVTRKKATKKKAAKKKGKKASKKKR